MYILVCYDISDNRRRARLHELLLGYGTPVQKSVFECQLTRRQFKRLQGQAQRFARKAGESIHYYQMCDRCRQRTQDAGTKLVEAGPVKDFAV